MVSCHCKRKLIIVKKKTIASVFIYCKINNFNGQILNTFDRYFVVVYFYS